MISSDISVWMIQISDNEISQYYKNKVLSSWVDRGYDVSEFEAITPITLHEYKILKFGRLNSRKSDREFTETEKAVWYSHYLMWLKCIELNEPIIIIEHDTKALGRFEVDYDTEFKFLSFNRELWPASAYYITPKVANILSSFSTTPETIIDVNVDGFIFEHCRPWGVHRLKACTTIMHEHIGSTIDHT